MDNDIKNKLVIIKQIISFYVDIATIKQIESISKSSFK